MNVFPGSLLIGILSFIAYKMGFYELLQCFNDQYDKHDYFQLATINVRETESNFDKVAKDLTKAFQDYGFVYLTDVKGFDSDELFKWNKWFFDLPLSNKMNIAKSVFNSKSPNVYRGYFPVIKGGHSYKEAFELSLFEKDSYNNDNPILDSDLRNITTGPGGRFYMRNILEEKNVWPNSEDKGNNKQFKQVMKKYQALYIDTSKLLFQLMAAGLGFNRTHFDYLFESKPLSTFRLIHYPTRLNNLDEIPAEAWAGENAIVTGAHFDSSMLTMLYTFNNSGLQIKPNGFNRWIDVPVVKDKFVINVGALFSHMVNGNMVATNHRVLDIGMDRYSLALFSELSFDADISKTFYGNENIFVGKYVKYGTWVSNRTSQFAEYATMDFGIVD